MAGPQVEFIPATRRTSAEVRRRNVAQYAPPAREDDVFPQLVAAIIIVGLVGGLSGLVGALAFPLRGSLSGFATIMGFVVVGAMLASVGCLLLLSGSHRR